jgi:hypothetical protein
MVPQIPSDTSGRASVNFSTGGRLLAGTLDCFQHSAKRIKRSARIAPVSSRNCQALSVFLKWAVTWDEPAPFLVGWVGHAGLRSDDRARR